MQACLMGYLSINRNKKWRRNMLQLFHDKKCKWKGRLKVNGRNRRKKDNDKIDKLQDIDLVMNYKLEKVIIPE